MYVQIKSIVGTYKGWLITLSLGVVLAMLLNDQSARQISPSYLRYLINRRDIAHISLAKHTLSIREQYTAEITLTPTALERYSQKGARFSKIGPHFLVFAGSSPSEVKTWEQNLKGINRNSFSFIKNY